MTTIAPPKTAGYGRVKAIPKKIPDGPACEKCRHLQFLDGSAALICVAGRGLVPAGCPDYKDASAPRNWMPYFDYDGRFRR